MEATTQMDGLRPTRQRQARSATAPGERAVALGLALLLNALAAALLLRAPTLPSAGADAPDVPIDIVWIKRAPRARPVTVPAVREARVDAAAADPVPTPGQEPAPATQATLRPRGGQMPAGGEPLPVPPGRAGPQPADAVAHRQDDYMRRGVFNRRPVDPFARQGDGPFRMQDNSLGGRFQRLSERADCADLRAQLRAGGNPDAIVRTMMERGCS